MKILFEEFSDVILTLVGGLVIITIVVGTLFNTDVSINHFEIKNNYIPPIEKIGKFECFDLLIESSEDDLMQNVIALSNSGIDIKDKVKARIKNDDDDKYVEYVLKYNDDFMIKKVKLFIMEDD